MAAIVVLTFTVDTYLYTVTYDDAAHYCYCETDAPEPITQATPAELGFGYNTVIYDHCVGMDLWEVKARKFWPFADPVFTADSVACGFTPPTCTLVIDSILVTNESSQYAEDGAAIVSASGGTGTKLYSLDNTIFQTSNEFSLLAPGSYTVYVKDIDNCLVSEPFTILEGAALITDPYPWRDNVCHWFGLQRDDVIIQIKEPIKWDSITLMGKRDVKWHGFNYQFSDGTIDMEFDCPAGKEFIEEEYNAKGGDGIVYLLYGYLKNDVVQYLFEGKLNLNTLKFYPGKIACSVERKDNNNLFQSRYETKISLDAATDLDGTIITPPAAHSFTLHAKNILRSYKNEFTSVQPVFSGLIGGINGYILFDTSTPEFAEIEDYFGYPAQVDTLAPVDYDKYNWLIKYRGTASIRVKFNADIAMYNTLVTTTTYDIKHYLRINGVETQLGATVSGTIPAISLVEQNTAIDVTIPLTLNPLDKIYIYTHLIFSSGAIVSVSVRANDLLFTLSSEEETPSTLSKGWWVDDTVSHVVQAICGSLVRSNFLSRLSAGQGSRYIINNGFQIRQYEPTQRALKISAKDLLEGLKALFCLGLGMQDVGGKSVIRIERVSHFYQLKEILIIDEIWDYKKEVAKELSFNEIEIGYETYQDDGYNTLDEFNTKREVSTPIQTNKAKLFEKSKLIASGYSIETSRRQQFAATATNSFQNDENPFIIAMTSGGEPEKDEAFTTVTGIISPETAYNLRISPLRMLINWFVWIRGSLFFKDTAKVLKTTFIPQNTDLTTEFLLTEPNPIGDLNKLSWQEKQDVELSLMDAELPIFKPEWIYFKCRLTPDVVEMVMKALKGQYGVAVDHGFVSFIDETGAVQSGWPYEIAYNFYTEQVDFKLLRKWA